MIPFTFIPSAVLSIDLKNPTELIMNEESLQKRLSLTFLQHWTQYLSEVGQAVYPPVKLSSAATKAALSTRSLRQSKTEVRMRYQALWTWLSVGTPDPLFPCSGRLTSNEGTWKRGQADKHFGLGGCFQNNHPTSTKSRSDTWHRRSNFCGPDPVRSRRIPQSRREREG